MMSPSKNWAKPNNKEVHPKHRYDCIEPDVSYTHPLLSPSNITSLSLSVSALLFQRVAYRSLCLSGEEMEGGSGSEPGSVFTASLEGMKHVKSEEGEMLTKPFLDVCKNILPVIDKFGAAMTLVKYDVGGNILRLESKYLSNPSEFNQLYSLVRTEIEAKTATASSSCTNGLLWLTRAMDFLVELFRDLLQNPEWTMSQACSDSYSKTLKKWHGWLASSSFSVAMKLAPDRTKFMTVIGGTSDLNSDIESFCSNFSPLLEENHKFLASVGLDELKAS